MNSTLGGENNRGLKIIRKILARGDGKVGVRVGTSLGWVAAKNKKKKRCLRDH